MSEREQFREAADTSPPIAVPVEARKKRRIWALVLGIPAALCVLCEIVAVACLLLGVFPVLAGLSEVNNMGEWPEASASPAEIVDVDLSHLGFTASQVIDAREEETWQGGHYEKGVLAVYESGGQDALYIWVLGYGDVETAFSDFEGSGILTEKVCDNYATGYLGSRGLIKCESTDAYNKTLFNEKWLLDVVALDTGSGTPKTVVDQVLSTIADHWNTP